MEQIGTGNSYINRLAEQLITILDSKTEPTLTKHEADVLKFFLKAKGRLTHENSNKLMASLRRIESLPSESHSFIRAIADRIFPRPPTTPFSQSNATAVMIHCTASLDPETYASINLRKDLNLNKGSESTIKDAGSITSDADVESLEGSTDEDSTVSDLTSNTSLSSFPSLENTQEKEFDSEVDSQREPTSKPGSRTNSRPSSTNSESEPNTNFELSNPYAQDMIKNTAQSLSEHAQEVKNKHKRPS